MWPIANRLRAIVLGGIVAICSSVGWSQGNGEGLRVHPLFSDNMVLQRDIEAPVWGWGDPGDSVVVELDGAASESRVDTQGKWMARMPSHAAGGPFCLTVRSRTDSIVYRNVMVGDVWIGSGQSNMEMGVGVCENGMEEIAKADYPNIRLFTVPKNVAFTPVATCTPTAPQENRWLVCSPEALGSGNWTDFSAVSYFFGRELHKATGIPIGLIHSSWGGTSIEAWMNLQVLSHLPELDQRVSEFRTVAGKVQGGELDFDKQMAQWWAGNDPNSRLGSHWIGPSTETDGWESMADQPKAWEQCGLDDFDGVVWFKKDTDLGKEWETSEAVLELAMIDDIDSTWINGLAVGGCVDWQRHRRYQVPEGALRSGRNTVVVRVLDTGGGGGFHGDPAAMRLSAEGVEPVSLAGAWEYKVAAPYAELEEVPTRLDNYPHQLSVLYNGMIAPLFPLAIKGALWYQGESNSGQPTLYRTLLSNMIRDWRKGFGVGDFPFYIVQLANYTEPQREPVQDGWASIRESQYLVSKSVKNAGLSVTIDIGDTDDIHPKNKQEVGRRLALIARARDYGENAVYSGPVYKSMRVRRGKAVLSFDHLGSGLMAKGDKLEGFAVAGDDGKAVFADAAIDGNKVIVSADNIPRPTAVYYGWADNPVCNLYNKEGLPAVPFRVEN